MRSFSLPMVLFGLALAGAIAKFPGKVKLKRGVGACV